MRKLKPLSVVQHVPDFCAFWMLSSPMALQDSPASQCCPAVRTFNLGGRETIGGGSLRHRCRVASNLWRGGKREEVPVDGDWTGGTQSYLSTPTGKANSTMAGQSCQEVFCSAPLVNPEAGPIQTSRKGRIERD